MKPVDRLRTRERLLREIEATLPEKAFRARSAGVALLEQDEMRRAAGALGRSPAYNQLIVPVLPTEPSGGDREDEPKSPPQTGAQHRSRCDDEQETHNDDYHSTNRGSGIEVGDAEGRPESIWDDDREEEDD